MDTTQWPQGINGVVKAMEGSRPISLERKVRPQKDQALNCPRCNSSNTKFCYYNNYSLSQPRYFCKTCRRYWTEGGSLRNVPVGGGSRKNKRSSSTSSSSITLSNSSKKLLDLTTQQGNNPNNKIHEGHDLNLAYNPPSSDFIELPFGIGTKTHHLLVNPNSSSSSSHIMSSRATLGSFMSNLLPVADSNTVFSSGFSLQEFKPSSLNFSLEGFESNGYSNSVQESSGARLLFPMEELKPVPSNTEFEQSRGQGDTSGFWNGLY